MENKILEAIALLNSNGFAVKKLTKDMIRDSRECEEMAESDEQKDCIECSCRTCIG